MKKSIIFVFLVVFISSCQYFRGDQCNNTLSIVGTYENIHDKGAKNILVIHANGTFEQEFVKDKLILKNSGKWRFYKERCVVVLDSLKVLHNLPNSTMGYFTNVGKFRLNNIVFVEDFGKHFDYYRQH